MKKLRIAIIQALLRGSAQERGAQVRALVQQAAALKPDLVTLPEIWNGPYQQDLFPSFAEPRFGPSWQLLSELAAAHGIWLSGGSIAEREGGKVYNTAYVFDRTGKEAARHRKMHLFDIQITGGQHFLESQTLTAGNEVTVFDTEFCRMGLCICYDLRFPELARLMVDRGAKLILVPAAFNMTTGPAHWELLFRQRAVDNQVFCIGTSPARDEAASYHAWGHSIVTDPWGRVVTQMDAEEALRVVELDLDLVEQIRAELPLLAHRRTDLYRLVQIP
ncbi:MAG: carbon-nitrogen hydrolase family protein [Oscillospiraceae bacterium]|nr:carbon-nitrogen hydrolase family protein [Oscillospiraceae bacterium]